MGDIMKTIKCSLLDAPTRYIAHQCNCCSQKAKGLAKSIFDKYPDASYPKQMQRNPGAISVHNDRVINCYAQWVPGKPVQNDTAEMRLDWFHQCLSCITRIPGIQSIAFPYQIGCGLAGGNWDVDYYPLLERFNSYCQSIGIEVILCKWGKL